MFASIFLATALTIHDYATMPTISSPQISPDGKRVVYVLTRSDMQRSAYESDLWLVNTDGSNQVQLTHGNATNNHPRWSPDGSKVAFLSDRDGGNAIWLIGANGGESEKLTGEKGSITDFEWSPDGKAIAFIMRDPPSSEKEDVRVVGDDPRPPHLYVVDVDARAVARLTRGSSSVSNPSWSPDGSFIAVEQQPGGIADFQKADIALVSRVIRWKNPKDGLEIEGLLTLPVGYEAGKRVPLLTFVHGGPASHFDQGFIGYLGYLYPVHVFAEMGFAILRPNPRGTGGYGQKFRQANRKDWGGMDWMDINAGIDKVIADGIADPQRLGLMGWSYGGFMAAWAEGHSDRLKAISIGAPVADLLSFHGTTDIRAFIPNYFRTASALDLDLLREHSPLWHLKPTSAHVLVQQGDADERVPLSQGTMLYRLLQEIGVDVTMVIYPRSPHVPREPRQRIDVMRRNVEMFTSVLAP